MHIISLGLSHESAPLAVRERLALSPASQAKLLAQLQMSGVPESAVVVSCGSIELFAAGPEPVDPTVLLNALAAVSGEDRHFFEPSHREARDAAAVQRLIRAATGLDAIVLGDPAIGRQVSKAWDRAVECGASGNILGAVFQAAIEAARRVRSETALATGAQGLPQVTAAIIARAIDDLAGPRVIVVGAGDAAAQVVEALRSRTAADIVLLNRTRAHAERLAREHDATTEPLHRLPDLMSGSHALITAVSSPQPLVSESMVLRGALAPRRRPLIIADLGLPRAVHYDAARLPAVQYMDLDTIATLAAAMTNGRSSSIPDAEAIVKAESERVMASLTDATAARVVTAPAKGTKSTRAPTG